MKYKIKIVKQGRLPEPKKLYGACSHCGCEVEITLHEDGGTYEDDGALEEIKCRTDGCHEYIYLSPKPLQPETTQG